MSQQNRQYDGPHSTFVSVKRVKEGEDAKGRRQTVVTIGLDKEGNNHLDTLIDTLTALRGKQVNLDIRVEDKDAGNGRSFPSAFLRVTEMIPKDAGGGGRVAYVPKQSKADEIKAKTAKIQQSFKG